MKKSSFGAGAGSSGRLSRGSMGAPLRVRADSNSSKPQAGKARSRSTSVEKKSRSLSFGTSSGGFGASSSSQKADSRISFVPKSGRPSSGIGVRGRTDIPKDPRPISDKKHISQSIKTLLEYLQTNSYPHPISHKLLMSPTSKDFFKIFSFIYTQFQPDYKMAAKMEEEVPRVLKMLAYPFSFSKAYLYSVGSPHTWPHLLAALMWMIELLQMTSSIPTNIDTIIFGSDFDGKSEAHIFFEYASQTYDHYMKGHDTFEDHDEEIRYLLKEKYQGGNLEALEAENVRMEEELNRLDLEEDALQTLQENIVIQKKDIQTLIDYRNDLDKFKNHNLELLAQSLEQIKALNSELEGERERLSDMQKVYTNQDLTPADVARLKAEQGRLRQQVEHLEKQVEDIEADSWSVTMDTTKANDQVEQQVKAYNLQAIKLKIVPESAELANGNDFRLKAGYNSDIETNFENNIKPMLKMMKIRSAETTRKKENEKFQIKIKLEKTEESLSEGADRLTEQGKELAKVEADIASLKQVLHTDKKTVSSELETMQENLQKAERELAELKSAQESTEAEREKQQRVVDEKLRATQRELVEIEETRRKVKASCQAQREKIENKVKQTNEKLRAILAAKQQRNAQALAEAQALDSRIKKRLDPNDD